MLIDEVNCKNADIIGTDEESANVTCGANAGEVKAAIHKVGGLMPMVVSTSCSDTNSFEMSPIDEVENTTHGTKHEVPDEEAKKCTELAIAESKKLAAKVRDFKNPTEDA